MVHGGSAAASPCRDRAAVQHELGMAHPAIDSGEPAPAQRLQAIFDRAPFGLVVTGDDARIVDANPAFCTLVGRPLCELVSRDIVSLIHPDDRPEIQGRVLAALAHGPETLVSEKRFVRSDGTAVWTRSTLMMVREPGRASEVLELIEDVSDRRAAESDLRRTTALVQIAGRVADVGGWSVDLATQRVAWSDVVALIHQEPPGFSPTIDSAMDYYVPEHRPIVREVFERCATQGTSFDVELQIVSRLGQRRWVRAIGQAERDVLGRITHVLGAFQEISKRKGAEEEARELTERLRTTLESITDAFFTVDRDWRVTSLNRRAEQILRRSRESLIGRSLWDEFPEAKSTLLYTEYHRAMAEQVSASFEMYYDPFRIWVEINAYPSPQGLALYFRDVTERRNQQEELRRLNVELEERVVLRT
jgi:PAS domain S-box-containing protein